MTRKPNVLIVKKTNDEPFKIDAVLTDSSGQGAIRTYLDGWSTHNEPEMGDRGLNIAINDDLEVLIPFDQVRKFVKYMDKKGL